MVKQSQYIMKLKNNIAIFSVIGFFAICMAGYGIYSFSNRSKRTLEKQLVAMDGMRINLDFENAITVYDGIDSTYFPSNTRKLVLYVDSTSCSGCFLSNLVGYHDINDSLVAHGGELLVLLHPQRGRMEEIKTRMRHERYPFWCIVDVSGEFIAKNPELPENKLLHTFSLDEQSNVILVGDPTRNEKINELFYREVLK